MKKVILKLELHDDKNKQKAMKAVSSISGVESVAMDMKEKKLTVIGDVDPVKIVAKLRKLCFADLLAVGPAKEEEKKKEEPKKTEDEKKQEEVAAQYRKYWEAYYQQNPHHFQYPPPAYATYTTAYENPNACVIC